MKFHIKEVKHVWWLLPACLVGVYFLPLLDGNVMAPLDIIENFYSPWNKKEVGGKIIHNHFSEDFAQMWLAERLFAWKSYQTGQELGWSDLTFSGTAQYANTMNVYYDWSTQLNRWLPFWDAWHLGIFGQLVIGITGMCVFLRSRGISVGGALLGSVCFGMNSMFFTWMMSMWMLGAMCWLPWFLWSLYGLRDWKIPGVLAPAFLCMGFLGGHLQLGAYYIILTASLSLLWIFEDYKKCSWKSLKWIGIFALLGILAVGLASFMFVPCVRAYLRTLEAGLERGAVGYPFGWLQPIKNLALYPAYLFPYILGRPQSLDFSKVLNSELFNVPFIGTLPAIFAVVFAVRSIRRQGMERGPMLFMVLGLFLPLTFLVGPLYQRVFILFVFGASWAAACAIDQKDISGSQKLSAILMSIYIWTTSAWVFVSGVVRFYQGQLNEKLASLLSKQIQAHRHQIYKDWWNQRVEQAVSDFQIWNFEMMLPWAVFGVALIFLNLHTKKIISAGILQAAVIATTFLQLFCFNKNFITYSVRPSAEIPVFEGLDLLQSHIKPWDRVALVQQVGRPELFPLNTLSLYGIAHHHGYGSIVPPGIQWNMKMHTFAKDLDPALYGQWGVDYAIGFFDEEGLPPEWRLIGRSGEVSLFHNAKAMSRYIGNFDGEPVALVPQIHQMNYRKLQIPDKVDRIKILENWDEGWEFRIASGKWLSIGRDNDRTMVAKFLPLPGTAEFEMRYRPFARVAGTWLTYIFLFLYLLFAYLYLVVRKSVLAED